MLDKPAGRSSFWLVRQVRRITKVKRVGHAGTLDPFATGLVVVLVGKPATRLQDAVMAGDKVYETTFLLGATSDSGDPTGVITPRDNPPRPSPDQLRETLARFRGEIRQQPPIFSAIKVGGERLYRKARRGESAEIPWRTVVIHSIELLDWEWPRLRLRVGCGKGTYIRSLAADIGEALGCGAYVDELRRTASGVYRLQDAIRLEELEQIAERSLPRESA